jgi:hypothetical protein
LEVRRVFSSAPLSFPLSKSSITSPFALAFSIASMSLRETRSCPMCLPKCSARKLLYFALEWTKKKHQQTRRKLQHLSTRVIRNSSIIIGSRRETRTRGGEAARQHCNRRNRLNERLSGSLNRLYLRHLPDLANHQAMLRARRLAFCMGLLACCVFSVFSLPLLPLNSSRSVFSSPLNQHGLA